MAKLTIDFQDGRIVEMNSETGVGNDYFHVAYRPASISNEEIGRELRRAADYVAPARQPVSDPSRDERWFSRLAKAFVTNNGPYTPRLY